MKLSRDQFLGRWCVREFVFSADGALLGTVQQVRTLHSDADSIQVTQVCTPCERLANHPLATFSGEYVFQLRRHGNERHYLGPDVHGHGTSFGDMFLCGQGVWPRFAYNFRSWSISLSPTEQLTGGQFYRGGETVAMIFGIGRLVKEDDLTDASFPQSEISTSLVQVSGCGFVSTLNMTTQNEEKHPITRNALDARRWVEHGLEREDHFILEERGPDFCLNRNGRAIGMAKAYGPMLTWETHGEHGESTVGLEVATPDLSRHFSLRQNFRNGRLLSLQGLNLSL